ncbi:Beta protein [Halanaerobium congolense]|uniref:Beta protein n=1 Tax=Halanaerobium congolense TaxID=54121 RepID=A0A1G8PYM2_9FIRM|nr:hypothetical protein [Halanaerobium congolense]SDI97356.1 Beta protein [Halanaerobium congolense]SES92258.1 Beta protein [Halanaerobium congolense]
MKYVPVMKWKRGERVAIRHINDKTKDHCKPVFNIMRKTIPEDYAYQIQRDWANQDPFI